MLSRFSAALLLNLGVFAAGLWGSVANAAPTCRGIFRGPIEVEILPLIDLSKPVFKASDFAAFDFEIEKLIPFEKLDHGALITATARKT